MELEAPYQSHGTVPIVTTFAPLFLRIFAEYSSSSSIVSGGLSGSSPDFSKRSLFQKNGKLGSASHCICQIFPSTSMLGQVGAKKSSWLRPAALNRGVRSCMMPSAAHWGVCEGTSWATSGGLRPAMATNSFCWTLPPPTPAGANTTRTPMSGCTASNRWASLTIPSPVGPPQRL
jgi:hypothetical protein